MKMNKIGLYNLEPYIVNTAMMQVSTYYKNKNYNVERYNHLDHNSYDQIYAFSIFNYTNKEQVRKDMICGGTGFDINSKLSKEIEDCDYDWSLYPNCNYSIIWFSRGCIRNCPFCVVRQKEGYIKSVKPKNLNPNGGYIKITDNNFFANLNWKQAIKQLQEWNQPVEFQCGIDVRLFNEEQGEALQTLKIKNMLHTAWDNPKEDLRDNFELLSKYIKPYRIMPFVLIGYWSSKEEDLFRVEELKRLGMKPFVMPYNKKERYQKDFARWVNRKAIFMSCKWEEYKKEITLDQSTLNNF